MNREVHVRLREGLRGKFPRSTRLPTIQITKESALKYHDVVLILSIISAHCYEIWATL